MEYGFERQQVIPRPREEVFAFFASAHNLQQITPSWLHFTIESMQPAEMQAGTRIGYSLRLRGLPVRWSSVIEVWEPPTRFVDVQLKGPYRYWRHEHLFADHPQGTLITDRVRYRLPFGILGRVAHPFVRRDLQKIFDYRHARIAAQFA